MKSWMKPLCFLCVLCGASCCFSLDREAFSITNYDLNLLIEPEQHRLGARGKITLRNDTTAPQKIAVLQISSSLDWRAIRSGDKMLQFVTQPYTSDIDHTGALSEAIVTLPQDIAPHSTVDLDIGYEGVIVLDATRLTRIGTPEDIAKSSDWDQIETKFTALRGAGYVAWYPIATAVANLSEENSLFEALTRWKTRERGWNMSLHIDLRRPDEAVAPTILLNRYWCAVTYQAEENIQYGLVGCRYRSSSLETPVLVIADYQKLEKPGPATIFFLHGRDTSAASYATLAEKLVPFTTEWFGAPHDQFEIADLAHPDDAPFESGLLLLNSLAPSDSAHKGLAVVHQLTHASFASSRPWVDEGLAHFAQSLYLEQEKGRQAALDYMNAHRSALPAIESSTVRQSDDATNNSLVSTVNDRLYRSKAMCIWWMLRDTIGDAALKKAIASYKPEQDDDPTYMPRLIAAQTQRDLSWFFDDWLYHDRGLPDFKVESAFAAKTPTNGFLLTVTLDNLGTAGAEVPVIIKFAGGEITKRIELRAKSKATFRVETPAAPQEIRVNDGSVPESDSTNNVFKITTPAK